MRKRALSEKELLELAELSESEPEPFSLGSSDNYEPSEDGSSDDSGHSMEQHNPTTTAKTNSKAKSRSPSPKPQDSTDLAEDSDPGHRPDPQQAVQNDQNRLLDWTIPDNTFQPAKVLPIERGTMLRADITKRCTPIQIFLKVFPHSLYLQIVDCTNQRLEILNKTKKKNEKKTDKGEIQKLIGFMFIMSYNKLPSIRHYWSQKESMGNRTIEKSISRDRFMTLVSKLYFAPPEKPQNPSKTYYIDEVIACLNHTFTNCRQDSVYQSIDESMTKFKGRLSLKQYMPLKPTKRGIKLWLRCDASSGYTYDRGVYSGKDASNVPARNTTTTLGERVVKSLAASIKEKDVVLCFDRFFTSVNLLETINFAALGTSMSNRKNVPSTGAKLQRGQSEFRCTNTGLVCVKWQDTKEVLLMSNCHKPALTTVTKKNKTGEEEQIECPEAIAFYRQKMGGVDRADRFIGLYDHDRKSTKWWKKVFYTCLSMCAVNAWIMYNDLRRKEEKISFLSFLVTLAEELIAEGIINTSLPTPKRGPSSKKRRLFGPCIFPRRGRLEGDVPGVPKKRSRQGPKQYVKNAIFPYAKIVLGSIIPYDN